MTKPLSLFAAMLLASAARAATADLSNAPLADVEALALDGRRDAMHALCYRHKYGIDAPQDFGKALRWCSVAAVVGVDSSQVLLAEMFHDGDGVPQDFGRARQWYEAGAEQGHPHALLMLFYMYDGGGGVEVDRPRALRYLERAAADGYEKAVEELDRQRAASRVI
ncbi:tetratricopeptide repeat protein [Cognatilysobacter segetis]|uniref:tetratricopeptide repeat protein n=1 Tax=Cognatilysobacter segetis TaxID=2492394 RepID=UPI00105C7AC2|nr:tetratricopeptide repeat protein [Lysobacter segetis]